MSNGIINMRESLQDRNERLSTTDCGRVLLSVINEFGSSVLVAEKIGLNSSVVSMWVQKEKISMRGARLLASVTGREKEEFRPDLTSKDWERRYPGPIPGQSTASENEDAKLLSDLASNVGGVSALCGKLGIHVGIYHNWKSRGKIPSRRREEILALRS